MVCKYESGSMKQLKNCGWWQK